MERARLEYKRTIDVTASYDLVVCGGGPGGCCAALAARREGLSVLLVESQAQLGGSATSGLVSHWLGGRTQESDWVVGGLFRSLAEGAVAKGVAVLPELDGKTVYHPHGWLPWFIHGVPLDPFGVACLLDDEMERAGVDVLLQTQAIDVETSANRIEHVLLAGKEGLTAVAPRAVVDATGDADIAFRSGCRVRVGREPDGLTAPTTLGFHAEGIDHDELSRVINRDGTPKFRKKISELRDAGVWRFPYDIFISVRLVDDDTAMINTSRLVGVDGTNQRSVSDGLKRGRRETVELMSILREHFPGFRKARVRRVASMLGIRETRRIEGDFELTVNHLTRDQAFDDCVGFSIYGWDLPDPTRPSVQPLVDESSGRYENQVQKALSTPIPYRILVPRPIENLVCVGRCVSVERDVLGPIRVMAPSMAMGEAAGTAASQVVREQRTFADVDTGRLRSRLRDIGCIVDKDALPPISPRQDP